MTPLAKVSFQGDKELAAKGQEALQQGLVGAIILAGGQGTRLNFNHPKGMFKVTQVKQKSLFQLAAEKAVAVSKRAERTIPLAFMTSPENDTETKAYFNAHAFFGAKGIDFFTQGMLPLLDEQGNSFLKDGKIATGPDGNGSCFAAFVRSPLFAKWKEQGVRYALITLVDNPLADPFDAELIGRALQGKTVVIKAIERQDPEELVGILVERDGRTEVIEYTEFPEKEKRLRKDDGTLLYNAANISLFCLSMDFIEEVSRQTLPLHKAYKKGAWKQELFIFDILPFASSVETVIYPRNLAFCPLKNAGDEELVQKALVESDRRVLSELLGLEPPEIVQEIAQDYYYPTEEAKKLVRSLPLNTPFLKMPSRI